MINLPIPPLNGRWSCVVVASKSTACGQRMLNILVEAEKRSWNSYPCDLLAVIHAGSSQIACKVPHLLRRNLVAVHSGVFLLVLVIRL